MYPQEDEKWYRWGSIVAGNYNPVNPVAVSSMGYKDTFESTVVANLDFDQKLDFITKGLSFKALISFKNWSYNSKYRLQGYNTYQLTDYTKNEDGTYNYTVNSIGDATNHTLDSFFGTDGDRRFYIQGYFNYDRAFGDHHVGGMLLYNQDEYNSNVNSSLLNSLPKRRMGIAVRAAYDYANRYLFEFNAGYNGSENFAKGHRFGFFPSVSVGWNISQEKFWEPILPVVSELKLKASYGSVGNDAIGGDRWIYQSTISTNNGWNYGENGSEGGGGIQVGNVENLNVSWEKAYKTNLGFEMRLFDRIKIQADYFHEKREGVFINRQGLPAIVGLTTKPKTNIGASVNRGVDATLEYEEKVGEVFLTGRANFTFNRNKLLNKDEVEHLYKYQNSIGKTFGTGGNHTFGLIAEGLFQSQEEIDNAPEQNFGTYRVGDVRYRDVNGDGVVDTYDKVALGYTNIPEITYGFGLTAQWRSWDINAFFQGIAHCTFYIGGTAMRPFSTGNINQSAINADIYDHVWKTTNTPEQNLAAYYPRLSEAGGEGSTNNNQTSTLTMRDGRFLRLKNFEIGYTIPKSILEKTFIKSTRIYVSGSNLLTFSKFKLWDPETGSSDGGIYPPLRVFTIGLNAKF